MLCLLRMAIEFVLLFSGVVTVYAGVWATVKIKEALDWQIMAVISAILYLFIGLWRLL